MADRPSKSARDEAAEAPVVEEPQAEEQAPSTAAEPETPSVKVVLADPDAHEGGEVAISTVGVTAKDALSGKDTRIVIGSKPVSVPAEQADLILELPYVKVAD